MKLIVALDLPTFGENENLLQKLDGLDVGVKVGLGMFQYAGNLCSLAKVRSLPVVLDLKLYDIPNTMANTARRISELGVSMFTIHASAGVEAMRAVVGAVRDHCRDNSLERPKILAVTALTSFSKDDALAVYGREIPHLVAALIHQAALACVDGVVCSATDLKTVDGFQNLQRLIKFVPGIELAPRQDDQKRKGGLLEVIQGGADYIVVGRQIYNDPEPRAATEKILAKIAAMQSHWTQFQEAAKWES